LSFHGVTRDVSVQGTAIIKGDKLKVTAKFSVKLSDYNITVPSVVSDKIGKEAVITLESDLIRK